MPIDVESPPFDNAKKREQRLKSKKSAIPDILRLHFSMTQWPYWLAFIVSLIIGLPEWHEVYSFWIRDVYTSRLLLNVPADSFFWSLAAVISIIILGIYSLFSLDEDDRETITAMRAATVYICILGVLCLCAHIILRFTSGQKVTYLLWVALWSGFIQLGMVRITYLYELMFYNQNESIDGGRVFARLEATLNVIFGMGIIFGSVQFISASS